MEHFWGGGRARLSSWLFLQLRFRMSLHWPKSLYGVTAPPLTPLIPALLQKPKWERRLLKLLSISALDAQGTSLLLPVEIGTTDTSELHSVKALLDNGATRSFIDRDFICSKGINTQTLSCNILVFNVDSSSNEAEQISVTRLTPKGCFWLSPDLGNRV